MFQWLKLMFDDDQNFSKASFSFFFNYFLQPIFRDLLKNLWSRVENQGRRKCQCLRLFLALCSWSYCKKILFLRWQQPTDGLRKVCSEIVKWFTVKHQLLLPWIQYVNSTYARRSEDILDVLCTFNPYPVSRGKVQFKNRSSIRKCSRISIPIYYYEC